MCFLTFALVNEHQSTFFPLAATQCHLFVCDVNLPLQTPHENKDSVTTRCEVSVGGVFILSDDEHINLMKMQMLKCRNHQADKH